MAFEKLYLGEYEQRELTFNIDPCTHLSTVKEDGTYMLDTGTHILTVGSAKHSIAIISADSITAYVTSSGGRNSQP